jgi:predicted kinase
MQVGVAHGRATLEKEPINKQGKQSIPQLHAMLMQRFHAGDVFLLGATLMMRRRRRSNTT